MKTKELREKEKTPDLNDYKMITAENTCQYANFACHCRSRNKRPLHLADASSASLGMS